MTLSPQEFVELYIKYRHKLTATDPVVFGHIERMGIEGAEVLDFGCGDGRYSVLLKKKGARSVHGIDNNPLMIEHALQKFAKEDNVQFSVSHGHYLPFADSSFDLVFANLSFHYVPEKELPLSELYRVLRPGGALVATVLAYDVHAVAMHLIGTEVPILLHIGAGSDTGVDELHISNLVITRDQFERRVKEENFFIDWYEPVENPLVTLDKDFPFYHLMKMYNMVLVAKKPKKDQ